MALDIATLSFVLRWVSFMLSVIDAECHKEAHYAECHYFECCFAECRGAQKIILKKFCENIPWALI